MTPEVYVMIIVAGLAVTFGFFVGVIVVALAKEKKYIKIQTILLANIAKKSGMNEEDMRDICKREGVPSII